MTPKEDWSTATGDLYKNFVKIGPAVSEICSQTDRQTDHNTSLLYRGGVTEPCFTGLQCYNSSTVTTSSSTVSSESVYEVYSCVSILDYRPCLFIVVDRLLSASLMWCNCADVIRE